MFKVTYETGSKIKRVSYFGTEEQIIRDMFKGKRVCNNVIDGWKGFTDNLFLPADDPNHADVVAVGTADDDWMAVEVV